MYGLTLETPIRCGKFVSPTREAYLSKFLIAGAGLEDDLKYLAKVRCPTGMRLRYLCKGTIQAKDGSCARWFIVTCECGKHHANLYIDSLQSGELAPPSLPGWFINPAGIPSQKDVLDGMELVLVATIRILPIFFPFVRLRLHSRKRNLPFKLSLEQKKTLLKITFWPDHENPLPFLAQLGHYPEPQPQFSVFRPGSASGQYICEFENIMRNVEYGLHFLADSSSFYIQQKQVRSLPIPIELFEGYGGGLGDPVCCGGGPEGEHAYLKRLRCPNGYEVRFSRKASLDSGSGLMVHGNMYLKSIPTYTRNRASGSGVPVDSYVVECLCGKHRIAVFMDMYNQREDRPIEAQGWTLIPINVKGKVRMGAGQHISAGNVGSEFLEEMKKHPELVGIIEDGLKKFGDDPLPKIIQELVAGGLTVEAQTGSAILLSQIGEPAIPHLIKLLGHDNYTLAAFAAKTLAMIEGSLPYVIKALKSEDPNTRLHAAGSLQYIGSENIQVIPDICEFIKSEIINSGETELEKIPESVGIATAALGKMGKAAFPIVSDLLSNNNIMIRIAAVLALERIGRSALPLLIEARSKEKDQLVFTALQDTIRRIEKAEPVVVRSHPVSTPPMPSVSVDAGMWIGQARIFTEVYDWKRARDCATKAIVIAPTLIEAYMIRALACRVIGELDEAIKDYTRIIAIDPQQGEAWMYRGACKTQKASSGPDQVQAMNLLNDAHLDYKRAAELMPDNEQAGLALLELEICAGKYCEAVGTTGIWWNRIQGSHNKLICAWLASIAFILAGKPVQKWTHFREFLKSETAKLNPTEWSVAEISGFLENLGSQGICDANILHEIRNIHEIFLRHFSGSGPAIKK